MTAVLTSGALLALGSEASASSGCDGWMMSMPNAGFEEPADGTPVPGWCTEGPDLKGVDRGIGWSRSGAGDVFIEAASTGQWNAVAQHVVVPPGRTVELSAYVWTSTYVTAGYFGVRDATGKVFSEIRFGPLDGYHRLAVRFSSGASSDYIAFVGFWSSGPSWLVADDFVTTLP
ncbi:MAG: hypothetical protein ACJ72N_24750 [Labedaea sp.]